MRRTVTHETSFLAQLDAIDLLGVGHCCDLLLLL